MVFKGYATGTGKKATMKVKDAQLLSWDDVQGNQSFGAILNQDFVDISFDTDELSQKFWDMAEKNNWNCLILENPENGHIHSYWKDTEHRIEKGGKGNSSLPVGDYYYQNNTWDGYRIAQLGGGWSNGSVAGGFYWSLDCGVGYRSRGMDIYMKRFMI